MGLRPPHISKKMTGTITIQDLTKVATENNLPANNAERERLRKEQETKEAAEKAASEAPEMERLKAFVQRMLECSMQFPTVESDKAKEYLALAMKHFKEGCDVLADE